jgi:O-antigen ligase
LVLFLIAGAVLAGYLYESQPVFREQIDKTILPAEQYGVQQAQAPGPIDDGARIEEWAAQAPRFWNAPVLGAGFWHRGGASTLWVSGSHNFWLQMLLELGIVGGLLVAGIVVTIWRQATGLRSLGKRADVPLKAALVAAFVGGMSGEYFYGGIILFTLLAVYAPTGGIPLRAAEYRQASAHAAGAVRTGPRPAGAPGD